MNINEQAGGTHVACVSIGIGVELLTNNLYLLYGVPNTRTVLRTILTDDCATRIKRAFRPAFIKTQGTFKNLT